MTEIRTLRWEMALDYPVGLCVTEGSRRVRVGVGGDVATEAEGHL